MNQQWQEVLHRNYKKSLDHRSLAFLQNDKRFISAKGLVTELKTMAAQVQSVLSYLHILFTISILGEGGTCFGF
jgi:histone deacetylase complex regulatory component SIN3